MDVIRQSLNGKTIVSYKGPISNMILVKISDEIKIKFRHKARISRKLFSIFIELAQNILYYSPELASSSEKGKIAHFSIEEENDHYLIIAGNYVENNTPEEMNARCKKINGMNEQELRNYRKNILENPPNKKSKGAGIGLIKVALTSGSPLLNSIDKVNDQYSFLTISTKIPK